MSPVAQREDSHMRTSFLVGITVAAAMFSLSASGQQPGASGAADQALPAGFETKPLIKTGKTREFPKTEKPEITSVIGTLQQGGRTPLHQHPVPVFVYVLEGELELQSEGQPSQVYKSGEAWIESLNKKHQVFNKGA